MNKETRAELAKYLKPWLIDGDPTQIKTQKIIHMAKKKLSIPLGVSVVIEKYRGETLYNTLKKLPVGTSILYLTGKITQEELKEFILSKPKDSKFPQKERYLGDDAWASDLVSVLDELTEYLKSDKWDSVFEWDTTPEETEEVQPEVKEGVSKEQHEAALSAIEELKKNVEEGEKLQKEQEESFKKKLKKLSKKTLEERVKEVHVPPYEGTPEGTVSLKKAKDVFPNIKGTYDVPVWSWVDPEGNPVKHSYVPEVDPNYIFREKELSRVLYALQTSQRMYLHGHTGSGKTTLIEQVAAHLNWPFLPINLDSEITRMDLIGRDTLDADEHGSTVSTFVDGVLPMAMQGPFIACFDELDFVRPDVAYVMQRVFEGNGLRITEDGGREVVPHEMFRMFATGNTVGQGDEHGMYQGARPQSLALLDRFTVWLKVDYLEEDKREKLISDTCLSLKPELVQQINNYVSEHLEAFTSNKVLQPITPRGMLSVAKAMEYLSMVNSKSDKENLKEALSMSVLDRATEQDHAVLKGLVDRVFK